MTTPQPCPKCGSEDVRPNYLRIYANCYRYVICVDCGFIGNHDDWNALRYAPATEEASSKPRRMQANTSPCAAFTVHATEHDETRACELIVPCQPVEAKPRQMRGNPAYQGYHGVEHDHTLLCDVVCCQPVEAEPAAPDHIANAGKMVEPDPGEGWRPLWHGETLRSWHCVEPEQAWEDVALERNCHGYLCIKGRAMSHGDATSLRGFMGYVYADGSVHLAPCKWGGEYRDDVVFPVSVRFAK